MSNAHDCTERQTILIVDDTPDNIALLSALLKSRYKTKVAVSGERALHIAAMDPPPDLILLDIMMPGMDGYETCRRLKENPHTAAIPVIFLTAMHEVESEEQGLKLGAVDYLAKPISPPIMLARCLKNITPFWKRRCSNAPAKSSRCRTRPSWRWPHWPKPATARPATISAAPSTMSGHWPNGSSRTPASRHF